MINSMVRVNWVHPNGVISEGFFERGVLHGQGIILNSDGNYWKGMFEEGKLKTGEIEYSIGAKVILKKVNETTQVEIKLRNGKLIKGLRINSPEIGEILADQEREYYKELNLKERENTATG